MPSNVIEKYAEEHGCLNEFKQARKIENNNRNQRRKKALSIKANSEQLNSRRIINDSMPDNLSLHTNDNDLNKPSTSSQNQTVYTSGVNWHKVPTVLREISETKYPEQYELNMKSFNTPLFPRANEDCGENEQAINSLGSIEKLISNINLDKSNPRIINYSMSDNLYLSNDNNLNEPSTSSQNQTVYTSAGVDGHKSTESNKNDDHLFKKLKLKLIKHHSELPPMTKTPSMKECSFKQPVLASYNSGDSVKVAKLVQKVQEEKQKTQEKTIPKRRNVL